MTGPMMPPTQAPGSPPSPAAPVASPPPPVQPPPPLWTPFAALPVDTEPAVATMRRRRLGKQMVEVESTSMPARWYQELVKAYQVARQASAAAQQAAAQSAPQGAPQTKGK